MTYDAIVAGAGIWGCTVARRLAEAGRKVLVLEKRAVVGGNCRCETDPETGIEVHVYGSHIFHTRNEEVWDFANRFTAFNDYRHSVLARYKEKTYHLPIGCTLLKEFFGRDLKPSELNGADREAIFEAFIRGYTSKQWGVPPEKVPASVVARLKVRDSFSTDYFDDPHQGIPADGYNVMFTRMLDHANIRVETDVDFDLASAAEWAQRGTRIFYSGPLDRLFDYRFGALPWRSLVFRRETLSCRDFQGASVVNYTEAEVPHTRIHEFKHYHPEWKDALAAAKTIVMREYPKAWAHGDEPYYPIDTSESAVLLKKYRDELECFNRTFEQANIRTILNVGGRLGGFRYFDMDQAMAAALAVSI